MDEILDLWDRVLGESGAIEGLELEQRTAVDAAIRADPALFGKPIEHYPMGAQEAHFKYMLAMRRILSAQGRLMILLDGRIAPLGEGRYLVPIEVEGESFLKEMDVVGDD